MSTGRHGLGVPSPAAEQNSVVVVESPATRVGIPASLLKEEDREREARTEPREHVLHATQQQHHPTTRTRENTHVRMKAEVVPVVVAKTFEAGQKVECRYMGMDAYYPGTVQKVDGGKYDVLYEDGGFEGGVDGILIRDLVGELSSASGGHGQAKGMASTSGFGNFEDSSIEAQAKRMGIPVEMLKEELEMQKQAAPSMKEAVAAKPTSPKRKAKNPTPHEDPPATATAITKEEKPWTKATSKASAGKAPVGGTATAVHGGDVRDDDDGVVNRNRSFVSQP
jgi:hypothetical protein